MSWIIQGMGCTPKVSALWPLWREVKGSAAAAGINGADMFRSGPECVCEWQRRNWQRMLNCMSAPSIQDSKMGRAHIDMRRALRPFNRKCANFSSPSESSVTFEPRRTEWVILSPVSTTCAVLLQNPCVSLNNVSNLSHKRRQSQYAREWRQIPDQESHCKLSYVWLYTTCTVNGKTI